MAKRTRAEFEQTIPGLHIDEATGASTSDTEATVTKGGLTNWAVTNSVPSPAAEGPTATGVVSDTGAVVKGSGEEGATAN